MIEEIKAPIDAALAAGNRPNPRRPLIKKNTRVVEVPIDHQPDAILGDGPSANTARTAMAGIRQSWLNIRDAAEDESVDLPRLATAAQGAMERALTVADKAAVTITQQMAGLDRQITDAIQPRTEPTLAAEIRSFWRGKGWDKGLMDAVAKDARTAGAVLSAPGYLSGLKPEQREVVRMAAVQAHAAEHQAALDEAGAALTKVSQASSRITEVIAPRIQVWREEPNSNLTALEEYGRGK